MVIFRWHRLKLMSIYIDHIEVWFIRLDNHFFQAVTVSVLLYGCTLMDTNKTHRETSKMENKQKCNLLFWTYPGSNTPQKSSCTAIYLPFQKPSSADLQELIYIRSVRILDVVQKTCPDRWMIGTDGERVGEIRVISVTWWWWFYI